MKRQSKTRNTVDKIKRKRIFNDYYDNRINDDNANDNLIVTRRTSSTISVNIPLESIVHSTIYKTSELLPRHTLEQVEQTKTSPRVGEDFPEQGEGSRQTFPSSTSTESPLQSQPPDVRNPPNFNIYAVVGTIVTIIIIIIIMITIIQKSIFIKENDDGGERKRFSFFWRFMKQNNINRDKLHMMTSISNNTDNSSERRLSVISFPKGLGDSRAQQFGLDNNNDSGNEITNEMGKFERNDGGIYEVINADKIEIESLASCGSDTIDLKPLESPNWDECME